MSVSQSDIDTAAELFSGVGTITSRKMMGGACFYADGQIFAMIASWGQIYLKAKGSLADDLAAQGSVQFTYDFGKGKGPGSMGYWSLPDAALDDPEVACDWARHALTAAGG